MLNRLTYELMEQEISAGTFIRFRCLKKKIETQKYSIYMYNVEKVIWIQTFLWISFI